MSEHSGPDDTAAEEPRSETTNVLRVAGMATLFGDAGERAREVAPELMSLGFADSAAYGERHWAAEDVRRVPERPVAPGDRAELWERFNADGTPEDATAFVVAVLGSGLERESAAAAAALWRPDLEFAAGVRAFLRDAVLLPSSIIPTPKPSPPEPVPWDPDSWRAVYDTAVHAAPREAPSVRTIRTLARLRLQRALRSPDPVTRSLASAALLPMVRSRRAAPPPAAPVAPSTAVVSTLVHGTKAWMGDWWRPSGAFHDYVRDDVRPDLYGGGAPFSWDGALRAKHRERAGRDLVAWATADGRPGLDTVFAHSYGGEIAARAVLAGAPVNGLVLLSSVVNAYVEAVASRVPVVDVRLRFDPVLALALVRQRIRDPNVTEVLFARWTPDHSETHDADAWHDEDVVRRGGLAS